MSVRCLPFIAPPGDPSAPDWLAALQAAMPEERVVALEALDDADCAGCEVAVVANPRPQDLRRLPRLRWVHSLWAGVERLLAELPEPAPAVVRLTDPRLAQTMAEAVLAWTLYLHRDMPRYARQQAARRWQPHPLPRRRCGPPASRWRAGAVSPRPSKAWRATPGRTPCSRCWRAPTCWCACCP